MSVDRFSNVVKRISADAPASAVGLCRRTVRDPHQPLTHGHWALEERGLRPLAGQETTGTGGGGGEAVTRARFTWNGRDLRPEDERNQLSE